MGIQDEEKLPLVVDAAKEAADFQQNLAVSMKNGQQAEWDGHLLECCGKCDYSGIAACAATKACSPCVWGFNMKRAFGASFWKHAVIFSLLFSFWSYLYVGAMWKMDFVCMVEPHIHPHHNEKHNEHHPHSQPLNPSDPAWKPGQGFKQDPTEQTFLAGATFNPEGAAEIGDEGKDEASGFAVLVNGKTWDEITATDDVNTQIQLAKNQAAEGMAQVNAGLGFGRKMLHKHDDDEEHESEKMAKKLAKKSKKEAKKAKKELEKLDDEDDDDYEYETFEMPLPNDGPMHEKHHHDGPESPACRDAKTTVGSLYIVLTLSFIGGVVYASRRRTAMRKKFGIEGSACEDCLAYTCCLQCALCQETRTLQTNNVHEGVWFGPTILATPVNQGPLLAPQPHANMKAPTVPSSELKA